MTLPPGDPELRGLARSVRRLFGHEDTGPAPAPVPSGDHPLLVAVRSCLQAPPADRDALLQEIRGAASDARWKREWGVLAQAAEALAGHAGDDPGVLADARSMVTPGVATLLVAAVGDQETDETRRRQLAQTLPLLGREVDEALLEALRREALDPGADRSVRRTYLGMVTYLADRGSDVLVRMAKDPDWRVVRNALHILGERGGPEARSVLRGAADHEDARVRREALLSLTKLGGDDAGALARAHLDDPDPAVRAQAARTVGILGVASALGALAALLESEPDDEVAVEVSRSLGVLGDPAAVPVLERRASASFFSRSPGPVRVAAYRALAAIGSPRARELVRGAADDRDAEVRRAVQSLLRGPVPGRGA